MRQGPGIWALGLATSAVLHLGAGAGLMAALQPEAVENQPVPESRLNVEAQQVTRSDAQERAPESAAAERQSPDATPLGVGAIAESIAQPQAPPVQMAALQSPATAAQPAVASTIEASTAAPVEPVATLTAQITPNSQQAKVQAPDIYSLSAVLAAPQSSAAKVIQSRPVTTNAAALKPVSTPTVAPTPSTAAPVALPAALVSPAAPQASTAPQRAAPSVTTPSQEPDTIKGKATLAFPGKTNVDPVSLAAFQSFTQPGFAEGDDVRDSLSALLSVPCARMQVIFEPETTTLQLTGHVPDAGQRAPLIAALQQEMGSDIAVADNLLVLPAPQCGALSGIADIGLPQSTDQITNPLIVGSDTHARAFRYTAGQPLVIEMAGADYPAYVYLDYFDADGNVIHLSPNDRAPLERVDAKAPITFGATSEDEPGLFVKIGPPYGQEIAAAFASTVPLYEGLRPIIEPADAYLAWMQQRVAAARAYHPDFKGEWVYFFVTTAAE